jgi:hypothetical protein
MSSSAGTDGIGRLLAQAFPGYLAVDAAAAVRVVPHARHAGARQVGPVLVGDVELSIPYRIYNDEPADEFLAELTATQRLVVHVFYSRHHDGRVRERHLDQVIGSSEPWIVPYVVQLLGEYVLEIVESVARGLRELSVPGSKQRAAYGLFAAQNRPFIDLTAARVASYWNAYYRSRYAKLGDYPGQAVLDEIRSAARQYRAVAR